MRNSVRLALEESMRREVTSLSRNLEDLAFDLRLRIDNASDSEGYYWQNCLDMVVRIKNEVHKLKDWVNP